MLLSLLQDVKAGAGLVVVTCGPMLWSPLPFIFLLCNSNSDVKGREVIFIRWKIKPMWNLPFLQWNSPLVWTLTGQPGTLKSSLVQSRTWEHQCPLLLLDLDVAGRRLPNKTCRFPTLQLCRCLVPNWIVLLSSLFSIVFLSIYFFSCFCMNQWFNRFMIINEYIR